jgi:hypothetical protein
MNQLETPEDAVQSNVPLPLKILVYTLFALLVVTAIAVATRFMNRDKGVSSPAVEAGIAWDIGIEAEAGEKIRSAVLDGRTLTLVIERQGAGERIVVIDTRRGLVIGTVSLGKQ